MRAPHPLPAPGRRLRRGFTVVEMAIVMVIMGLLAAMAIPRIGRGIAQRELERVTQALVTDIQQASLLAARHRRPVLMRNVTGGRGYEIVDRDTPANRFVYRNYGTASNTNATISTFADLTFFPSGVTSGTRTITITVDNTTRTVTVSRVGYVRRS